MPELAKDVLPWTKGHQFGTILADPPWQFQNKTGKIAPEHRRLSRYSTMTFEEIMALPVEAAAAGSSHLYLWVPNALLPQGLAVMQAWGFTYKTNIIWHKVRKDGGPDGRGVGFYFRNVTEMLLFGVRGKNARTLDPGRTQVNYMATRKREHSRKPDEQYTLIEECSRGPFLELFARGVRDGWECWGNEAQEEYKPGWDTYKHNSSTAHSYSNPEKPEAGKQKSLSVLELCAGAGGQALGLEQAGFEHTALVEIDGDACKTLRENRPHWTVIQHDIATFDAKPYRGVDLVAAGLPCPPFSLAGRKLGEEDERNLFPAALRIIDEVRPQAVMIENVRGLLDRKFAYYRELIAARLRGLGYETRFELLNAADFGVPQKRPRVFIIGLLPNYSSRFQLSRPHRDRTPSVGDALFELISSNGWKGAPAWREKARGIAPAVVGGSKKHGGPDLGPTRARVAWAALGVDGRGIVDRPPSEDFSGAPRLTVPMVARIQGFPADWRFSGRKTTAYRQVGNALPPPLACTVARSIFSAIMGTNDDGTAEDGREANGHAGAPAA